MHYARNDIPIFPAWNPTENGGYVLLPPSVYAKRRTYARQGAWYGE